MGGKIWGFRVLEKGHFVVFVFERVLELGFFTFLGCNCEGRREC